MIKLDIRRFEQKDWWFCGPAILQSVLDYYGIEKSQEEIAKGLGSGKKYGTFLSDMGIYAKKLGLKAKIVLFDTEIIDPTWTKINKEELIKKLAKRMKATKPNKKRKHTYKSLIKYLRIGGTLSLEIPSKKLLIQSLKNKEASVIPIGNKAFFKTIRVFKNKPDDIRGTHGGHFIIIKGYRKGKFLIVDPLNKEYYKKEVDEDELLFSWFYWGGWLLIIGK